VAALLHANDAPMNAVIAGVLHDILEDTGTTREEMELFFGPEITAIVVECTDDRSLSKVERKRRQVSSASGKSTEAKFVKLADKYDNLSTLSSSPPDGWSPERIRGYIVLAAAVVDGLRGTCPALEAKLDAIFDVSIPKDGHERALLLDEFYASLEEPAVVAQ
jgi:hypothetical protein